jgi:NADH-quinone oxidoreductase subunit M
MSFQLHNILIFLLVLPLVGILSIFFLPTWNDVLIKKIALFFSGLSVILSLFLLSFFNFSQSQFQFYLKFNWISNLNFNFILGIDGISLFFILLTNLLIFLCILLSWNFIKYNLKLYFSLFFFFKFSFNWGFLCFRFIIILYFF